MGLILGIFCIITGLILCTSIIGALPAMGKYLEQLAKWLGTFQSVIGIIAIVVGIIYFSLVGLLLIIAGIILAIGALQAIPALGPYLEKLVKVLAGVQVPMGIIILIVGILDLVGVL